MSLWSRKPGRPPAEFSGGLFSGAVPAALTLPLAALSAVCPLSAAGAVEMAQGTDQVVISATRLPTPVSEVASSVTVVTAEEIEARQERTLHDVLQDIPGLVNPSYGGPGTQVYLFTRGTNVNHTKILVDGIDMSDPSQSDGSANLATVLAGDIERVEMLRGPQSGLYGSDAIGGVLNIITRKGEGPLKLTASVEGGSFATFNQNASASGSEGRFHYALNLAHFSTQAERVQPDDAVKPGARRLDYTNDNKAASGKFGADLTDSLDVGLVFKAAASGLTNLSDNRSGKTGLGYMGTGHNYQEDRQFMTRGTLHQTLWDGAFEQTLGLAEAVERRHYAYSSDQKKTPSVYGGNRTKIDWQGNIRVIDGHVITLGAEREMTAISDLIPQKFTTNTGNTAGYAQLQSKFDPHFVNTVSIRHDDNDTFGGANTYRLAPAILLPETDSKIKASMGTGFHAPSLDQLYHSYPSMNFFANPNLRPEKSLGWDAGFEQGLVNGRVQFGSTYFHNNIRNMIVSGINPLGVYTYSNVSTAVTKGLESFISVNPLEGLTLRADYTRLLTDNTMTRRALVERPKNKLGASAIWQAGDNLRLSVNVTGMTDSYSYYYLRTAGWWTADVAADYQIGPHLSVFGRIDNMFDREYAEMRGYLAPRRGVFGGIKITY
ncbi:MAG: TonB-dependent receptor [Telmatospirillum sp.]|nr:TonB-dependent receptor [Telmatospirillum sp.]